MSAPAVPAVFVGIDVAKATLDVAVRPSGERWTSANEAGALPALVTRLRALAPALIVLEATGGFEHAAVAALAAAGLSVVVANPRQVLDAMLTRRRQLLEMLVAEKNRLGFARAPVRQGIQ